MPVEAATYINQLDPNSPQGTDPKSQGDDHLRTIKSAVKQTFPNVAGAVNTSHIELNHLVGVASAVQPQIDLKASKTGDSYTGIHDFSLATSVKLPAATTIGAVTAAELGYLSGVTSAIQSQFSGVNTALTGKVSRSGDTYTGSHAMTGAVVTVATQAVADSTTKAASTQFVKAAIADSALSASLPGQAGNEGRFITTDGANASWGLVPLSSIAGVSNLVTTDGSQTLGGQKTFTSPVIVSDAFNVVSYGRSVKKDLDTSTTRWYTLCRLPASNVGMYSRFLFRSFNYFMAEITFGRTVLGYRGAYMHYKVLGAYGFWYTHPYRFRITTDASVGSEGIQLEFCFPGNNASTSDIQIRVLEEFASSGFPEIDYPLVPSGARSAVVMPNAVTVGTLGSDVAFTEATLRNGATYAHVVDGTGAIGQAPLQSSTAALG